MRNIKISATLGLISLACALFIALINMVTSPVIKAHDEDTELTACKEIFSDFDKDKSNFDVSLDGKDKRIIKIIIANDKNGDLVGTIYKVSGNNEYGKITLMVGITKDNKVKQVEFIENGQSFASTVNSHVLEKYPASESTDVHLGFKPAENNSSVGELDLATVSGIDVKCGATYGATLVKNLVTVALEDAQKEAE